MQVNAQGVCQCFPPNYMVGTECKQCPLGFIYDPSTLTCTTLIIDTINTPSNTSNLNNDTNINSSAPNSNTDISGSNLNNSVNINNTNVDNTNIGNNTKEAN
jgi:hypothetical protein